MARGFCSSGLARGTGDAVGCHRQLGGGASEDRGVSSHGLRSDAVAQLFRQLGPDRVGTVCTVADASAVLNSIPDDDIVVHIGPMGMYVIDSTGGLWRVDREAPEDWNHIAVERPACSCCGHRDTGRFPLEEVDIDPTDQELAELEPIELARFGMTRDSLLGVG